MCLLPLRLEIVRTKKRKFCCQCQGRSGNKLCSHMCCQWCSYIHNYCSTCCYTMGCQEICKLCLEKCGNFKPIDENAKNAFNILQLKIDFTIVQEPIICKNCAEILIKCCVFKTTCLRTLDYIVPFVNKKDGVKLDLKDVYQNNDATGIALPDDQDVCGFCMGLVKKCLTVPLNVEAEAEQLQKMLEQCLPELDLSMLMKPVACMPCHESLQNCFRFVTNCLGVEEKAKNYYETLNTDSNSRIDLNSLLQFTNGLTTNEAGGYLVDKIKVEHFYEGEMNRDERIIGKVGDIIKLERIFFDDFEDAIENVEIKNESFMEIHDQKVNNDPKNMLSCGEKSDNLSFIKKEEIFFENDGTKQREENLVQMEDQKFSLHEKIEIKTDEPDISGFEDGIVLPHLEVATGLRGSPKCLTPNLEEALSKSCTKHSLANTNASKKRVMYHCEFCTFQTKLKTGFKRHLLVHKDPSEVTMHKCDSCSFQTKYIRCLKRHSLLHKGLSGVTVYKCDSCSYQTKHKKCLNRHLLLDPLNVVVYECDSCSFQTRYKLCLKSHLLSHKDPLEVKMYKCDFCPHQTKYRTSLNKHLIVHKDPSELTMHKCTSCSFQTKHKNVIKQHLLGHTSEVPKYKCDSCSFQTRTGTHLKSHMLVHKDPSEIIMHSCNSCSFQTKRKDALKRHLLRHKKPSEITMHKCKLCSFQTKLKYYMKHHYELIHKKKVTNANLLISDET